MERKRAFGAMLITAPSPAERVFEMSVRLARAELSTLPGYTLHPSLTIRANVETGDLALSACVKSKRVRNE